MKVATTCATRCAWCENAALELLRARAEAAGANALFEITDHAIADTDGNWHAAKVVL